MAGDDRRIVAVAALAALVGGATGAVVTIWVGETAGSRSTRTVESAEAGAVTLNEGEYVSDSEHQHEHEGEGEQAAPPAEPAPRSEAELAPPAAPPEPAPEATGGADAGTVASAEAEAGEPVGEEPDAGPSPEQANVAAAPEAIDAGPSALATTVSQLNELARGPTFSAGAGRFATEPPSPAQASAWVSDPNAGAGQFVTAAPPWAASAITDDPQAGAGPFTTDRSTPGWPIVVVPLVSVVPIPTPSAAGASPSAP
jgi:hypothetical protein